MPEVRRSEAKPAKRLIFTPAIRQRGLALEPGCIREGLILEEFLRLRFGGLIFGILR